MYDGENVIYSRKKALLAVLLIAAIIAVIPSAKVSEGYVVDNYSIVMGTDGSLSWSTVPSVAVPVGFPVLYYSISRGYVLGSAVVLASFYTGTGYSVVMKYYRYGRLYPAVFLDKGSSEIALFVGYYDTVVDPLPNRSNELSIYEEIALNRARSYSPILHELLKTAMENATKVVINTDSAKGITRVDWYVNDDYVATVTYVATGTGLEVAGFDVTIPRDVMSKLGLGEEVLVTDLRSVISRRISDLPPWVSLENITIPGERYAGEVYLAVDGMRLAILHEETGSVQVNLGILYGIMRARQGIGIVFYDNTNLISDALANERAGMVRPAISADEAREIAYNSLGRLAGGEPGTIVVDDAFALVMPNGTITPAYIIESIREHDNYTGTKYLVVVNMVSGGVIERKYEVDLLGSAADQDIQTSSQGSEEQPANGEDTPAHLGAQEPLLIPSVAVGAGIAVALAGLVRRRK